MAAHLRRNVPVKQRDKRMKDTRCPLTLTRCNIDICILRKLCYLEGV